MLEEVGCVFVVLFDFGVVLLIIVVCVIEIIYVDVVLIYGFDVVWCCFDLVEVGGIDCFVDGVYVIIDEGDNVFSEVVCSGELIVLFDFY